jgi:beta-1,4-mannosyl-glycoprotein beta-1,4-N-acetylglucosaminyltransferase
MKIIDCFTFYNELQLLEYRLSILYHIVDYFIIVESNQTHRGENKELFYNKNKERFAKFKDKIIHIIVDLPYKFPNINYKNNKPFQVLNYNENGDQWINEAFQRECIKNGFEQILLNDEDYVIVSDVDEIPDPRTLMSIKNEQIPQFEIYKLKQDFYKNNLNSRQKTQWVHPYITSCGFLKKFKNIEKPIEKWIYLEKGYKYIINNDYRMFLSELRLTFQGVSFLEKGGWYLSDFGNLYFLKNKYESFSHTENKAEDAINEMNENELTRIKENDYLPIGFEKYLSNFIVEW